MRLVCVLFTFENNTGRTDGPTDRRSDGRTDTTSYRDATTHLKRGSLFTRVDCSCILPYTRCEMTEGVENEFSYHSGQGGDGLPCVRDSMSNYARGFRVDTRYKRTVLNEVLSERGRPHQRLSETFACVREHRRKFAAVIIEMH